ncbi:DUF222 domain-containing protein [Microbacterium sp. ASV81]|uniref:DUF222 domain-containing protein n=1 Tax=Microbacterium capsulatum TaxID=3041921 RepID=A0ABU0XKB5_9MICO|nr:DUF222 domain-containing protein [Microbacterium sp. ASV81]MDQ4215591.1 DUF222 domain-containing protein [Microbacterium sp. ASV81]
MAEHLTPLHEAIARLDEVWEGATGATALSRAQLIAANDAIGLLRRRVEALHAEVAAGIASESRPELGADSLAKQQGFRTPAQLIATTTGGSVGDATRLVAVGTATASRTNLLGEPRPPKYPAVQRALTIGDLSAPVAATLLALLERMALKIDPDRILEVEELLVAQSAGLSLDEVRRLVTRAEAWLDPDGTAPREEQLRARRSLSIYERDGMIHLDGAFDAATGAPIVAAVNGYVTAMFAARKNALAPDAADADHRTVATLRADALSALCAHALGCDTEAPALAGATVVVRVDLKDLTEGTGYASVDGSDLPISVSSARRLAASGGTIPCVLGTDREILDWGREQRFFTRAQRLALVERDGGCAMCGLPPSMTRAHHIRWWKRDAGPTDLANGILLCESCHHRIHDNDWEIRIEGRGRHSRVWFIPPPGVDPDRTPRLGGRARYDLAA